jgi:hypothetical protein
MSRPLPTLAELDDYADGALAEPEAEALEELLFEAAMRGEQPASEYLALRDGIVNLVQRGTFAVVMTEAGAERVRAAGHKLAYLDVDATGPVTLSRSAEVLLLRFGLDLRDVKRLDVELLSGDQLVKTIADVEFEPADGAVYMACEAEMALAAAAAGARHRFVAVDGQERRVLREHRPGDVQIEMTD